MGALVQGRDGNLYGSSYSGGTSDDGSIFKVSLSGAITVVHDFTTTEGGSCYSSFVLNTDGNFIWNPQRGQLGRWLRVQSHPSGSLDQAAHVQWVAALTETTSGPLTLGSDGNFLRNYRQRRHEQFGNVLQDHCVGNAHHHLFLYFQQFPAGTYDVIQGTDGNFYGSTGNAGTAGTIVKITSAGVLTTLHTFTGAPRRI